MSFEETVLACAAPALCGIKPASLFSLTGPRLKRERAKLARWSAEFAAMGRRIQVIRRSEDLFLCFAYDRQLLERTLGGREQVRYLSQKGYPVRQGWDSVCAELFARLSRGDSGSFPHEIGLFLGYPLSDVIAFEQDGGRRSKYTGSWQVYGNVEEACRRMKLYKECSRQCCRQLAAGTSVPAICKEYAHRKEQQT